MSRLCLSVQSTSSVVLAACFLIAVNTPANSVTVTKQQSKIATPLILPAGILWPLDSTDIVFTQPVTLNAGDTITYVPGIDRGTITFSKLILNGPATIDLTQQILTPVAPPQPVNLQQPAVTLNGVSGTKAGDGANGKTGIGLILIIQSIDATNGSLWVRTDGTNGQQGGPGGNGQQGGGPQTEGPGCTDAGNGGPGAPGGTGGAGGNTASVTLVVGPPPGTTTHPGVRLGTFSPSLRPNITNGAIAIGGAPGRGGLPGAGGNGGGGHKECHWPDHQPADGNPGPPGAVGSKGSDGQFVP